MSDPVAIISTDSISLPEFVAFLKRENALDSGSLSFVGGISDGERRIWIALSPESLSEALEEDGPVLLRRLVRQPKSHITVEIRNTKGSEQLAIEFAIKVLSQWHGVLSDCKEHLLDLDDLRQMKAEGRGFPPSSASQSGLGRPT